MYSVPFFPAIWVEVGAAALVDSAAADDVIADAEDDAAELDELELFDW